ncbi:MAG: iron ABC transporter permease [Microscillaceae bacterium]|nr:iron ABC transporter permease [Microscillaceae bacterium]MDW8460270.1 iron ABC transporter permease [Cytophagales bacterium]
MAHSPRRLILFFCILLIVSIFASLRLGAVSIDWVVYRQLLTWQSNASYSEQLLILQQIRLPRVVLAVLVGSALSVGGVLMQTLFHNPLVEPSLVGISGGSALFAVLYLVFGKFVFGAVLFDFQAYILPLCAFAGGWLATLLAQYFAQVGKQIAITRLLLLGVAINSFTGALIGFFLFFAEDATLRSFTFWSLGSLAHTTWEKNLVIASIETICLGLIFTYRKTLDVWILGEREAFFLGINTARIKQMIIWLNALLISTVIAFVGMIGFIGLIVPHIIRLTGISQHKYLLPLTALAGAILLLWADTLARIVVSPSELPIGVITALIGTPFFVFLLLKDKSAI